MGGNEIKLTAYVNKGWTGEATCLLDRTGRGPEERVRNFIETNCAKCEWLITCPKYKGHKQEAVYLEQAYSNEIYNRNSFASTEEIRKFQQNCQKGLTHPLEKYCDHKAIELYSMIFYGSARVATNSVSYNTDSWGAAVGNWSLVDTPDHFIAKKKMYKGPPRMAVGGLTVGLNCHGVARGICWGMHYMRNTPKSFHDLPAGYGNSEFNEHLLLLRDERRNVTRHIASADKAETYSFVDKEEVIVRTPTAQTDSLLVVYPKDTAWLPLRASGIPKHGENMLFIPAYRHTYMNIPGYITPKTQNNLCWFLTFDPKRQNVHSLLLLGQIPCPELP